MRHSRGWRDAGAGRRAARWHSRARRRPCRRASRRLRRGSRRRSRLGQNGVQLVQHRADAVLLVVGGHDDAEVAVLRLSVATLWRERLLRSACLFDLNGSSTTWSDSTPKPVTGKRCMVVRRTGPGPAYSHRRQVRREGERNRLDQGVAGEPAAGWDHAGCRVVRGQRLAGEAIGGLSVTSSTGRLGSRANG